MANSSALTCIIFIIYTQSIWHLESQWQTIWSESFDSNFDSWSLYNSAKISCPTSDEMDELNCPHVTSTLTHCCSINVDLYDAPYVERVTDISSYSALHVVSSVSVPPFGVCGLHYAWDDDVFLPLASYEDSKNNHVTGSIVPPGDKQRLCLRLRNLASDDMGMKTCYWDDIKLMGIPKLTTSNPSQSTPDPTRNPTLAPTRTPTSIPTGGPTRMPSMLPTLQTSNPSANKPTMMPSVTPTDNVELFGSCNDNVISSYHDDFVTFVVTMEVDGELQFDTSRSSFVVTDIEAFTKLNMPLGTDTDGDGVVTLTNVVAGQYKFIIYSSAATSGTLQARIRCFSDIPALSSTNETLNHSESRSKGNDLVSAVSISAAIVACLLIGVIIAIVRSKRETAVRMGGNNEDDKEVKEKVLDNKRADDEFHDVAPPDAHEDVVNAEAGPDEDEERYTNEGVQDNTMHKRIQIAINVSKTTRKTDTGNSI